MFQHPLYWYSTPSIIKEWLDLNLDMEEIDKFWTA
ncbi:NAD(P)H-dependent oxidoreductase [Methanolobus sp. WCC5]